MDPIKQALELLAVGMITVFAILALVVLIGKVIILIVNKYMPEEKKVAVTRVFSNVESSTFNSNKLAAIVAAVDSVTKGKGKVTKIEKAN